VDDVISRVFTCCWCSSHTNPQRSVTCLKSREQNKVYVQLQSQKVKCTSALTYSPSFRYITGNKCVFVSLTCCTFHSFSFRALKQVLYHLSISNETF